MIGGADRVRTDDLRRAKPALSQLSYSPSYVVRRIPANFVVGLGRIELPTSPLSGVRSNRLSYRPLHPSTPPSAQSQPRRATCRDRPEKRRSLKTK